MVSVLTPRALSPRPRATSRATNCPKTLSSATGCSVRRPERPITGGRKPKSRKVCESHNLGPNRGYRHCMQKKRQRAAQKVDAPAVDSLAPQYPIESVD